MKIILKKYLPQIIGLLLIAAITVVVYFTFFDNDEPDTLNISDGDIVDTSYTDNSDSTSTYVRTIPKQSLSSDSYLYYQNITGDGNIFLCNMHQTTLGNYLVCESDCSNGDIQGDKRSVGIALCDNLANISQVYNIPAQYSSYYINSQITPVGIVIITTNALKEVYYINIVSFQLDSILTLLVNYADNAIIYPTLDSFVIIAEYDDENIIYRYDDSKLSFAGMMAGNVVDLYEYGTYYTLFCNNASGYCITKINKTTLSTMSETYITGFTLISINPISEDNTQKFILLETNGTVYARKMTKLDNTDSIVAKLGSFTVSDVCNGDNQLVMVCSGRLSGLVYLNYDLTCQYGESNNNYWVTDILDNNYVNGTFYYLTINSSCELILITQKDNTTFTRTLGENCQKACFIFQQNNSIMVSYQTISDSIKKIEIIGLSK